VVPVLEEAVPVLEVVPVLEEVVVLAVLEPQIQQGQSAASTRLAVI
jgi:hypothetical protein